MGHVTGEPEDVHGFAQTKRGSEKTFQNQRKPETKEGIGETKRNEKKPKRKLRDCVVFFFFLFLFV